MENRRMFAVLVQERYVSQEGFKCISQSFLYFLDAIYTECPDKKRKIKKILISIFLSLSFPFFLVV